MEELFRKTLLDKKKNTVDEIIKWLKNSNLIDSNTQQRAVSMFSGENKNNVSFAKFSEVVLSLAQQKKWSVDTVVKRLTEAAAMGEKKGVLGTVKNALGGICIKKN